MKKNKLIIILMLCIGQISCKKYLDIKKSSSQGTPQTIEDCQLLLDNYTIFNTGYASDGEVSCDDYYVLSANYLDASRVSSGDRDVYTWQTNARIQDATQWTNSYNKIYNANVVLETEAKLAGGSEANLNDIKGSALFYRAYALWDLAQLYAKPYNSSTASQDLGIPIRLISDINERTIRGTVQETYDQILQDLQQAVTLLPSTSTVVSRPNKAAAYAMLARVYLSMMNYSLAQINANAALQLNSQLIDYNTLSASSRTPFAPRFNKEVIFHSITSVNNILTPGSSLGNNFAKIDPDLMALYSSNDLRRSVFFKDNGDGTFRFSGNYEPATSSTLFNGLATDELYLIRAECYARAGNNSSAMSDLNALLRSRWKAGTYIDIFATNADDALSKVLTERRKELVMRAQRWTDLRRLNMDNNFKKDLNRNLSLNGNQNTYTLPGNDPRYTLLIPQSVIDNSGVAQNPR